MRVFNIEYKKSILMIILIALSLLQMGILWTEKNPGVPFLFSSKSFWSSDSIPYMDKVKENYLIPERIMISDGTGDLYYPLNRNDRLYSQIWADFKESYLKQVIDLKPVEAVMSYERDWYSLIKMKSIIFEFKNPMHVGIIRWATGMDTSLSTQLKKIYKIAVFPSRNINYDKNTLYVYDGENVYKYEVKIQQGMKKEEYTKVIENIRENKSIIAMNRLIYTYPSVKNEELVVSLDEKSERKIWDLLVTIPDEIILNRENANKIEKYLLDDSFRGSVVDNFKEDGSSIIFSDTEQVLRYYQNGFLDYQFRNKNLGEKGLVEEAFENALTFIEYRRNNLIEGIDIYLSNIKEHDKNYEFTFDYVMDEMEIKIINEQDKTVKPAIVITANSDRVVDVKWYIRTFDNNDYYNNYSLYFYDIFENRMINEYPQLKYNPDIYDISIDYICSENGTRAEPYWLIETESQLVYLKMQGKGD